MVEERFCALRQHLSSAHGDYLQRSTGKEGGPCPAWAPHLLTPGSVQPQGTPGWEGRRGWFGGLVLLPGKAAGLGASILAVWADLEKLLNLCKKLVNVSPFGGPFLPPQCPLPP